MPGWRWFGGGVGLAVRLGRALWFQPQHFILRRVLGPLRSSPLHPAARRGSSDSAVTLGANDTRCATVRLAVMAISIAPLFFSFLSPPSGSKMAGATW